MRAFGTVLASLVLFTGTAAANDYPTVARADYVFACMASNGQSRQVLEQCACSIDVIASQMAYTDYVEVETIMQMRQMGGDKGTLFRVGPRMKEMFGTFKRAQAEAEIRCF
jgi:lysyl-tRNA synthetase class II